MSEQSQGPGWWVASNGKWYPPESHPNYRPLPPAQRAPSAPARPVQPVQPPVDRRQAPRLASERVVIQSPTSFSGSGRRIWKLTDVGPPAARLATIPLAVVLVLLAWVLVLCWYLIFGLFLVPWRLIRRGGRKRKRDELRHRETLER